MNTEKITEVQAQQIIWHLKHIERSLKWLKWIALASVIVRIVLKK